jgi:hypothetical protein
MHLMNVIFSTDTADEILFFTGAADEKAFSSLLQKAL